VVEGFACEGSGNAECERGSSVELKGARDGTSSRKGGEGPRLGGSAGSTGREGALGPLVLVLAL
jgi:hypothetical protein